MEKCQRTFSQKLHGILGCIVFFSNMLITFINKHKLK